MALVKHNNNSISSITTPGSLAQGKMTLISSQTASGSASIEFTTGIDSTYPIYKFEFINIHPANNYAKFQFNLSTDSGSNYNVTKTTTYVNAYNSEYANGQNVAYSTGNDLAQSTSFQNISSEISNQDDAHTSGTMTLYNPSSTTFVKHFMSRVQVDNNYYAQDEYMAGYGNTTSSVNAIQFKYHSGNIDSGKIKLYGIKDS